MHLLPITRRHALLGIATTALAAPFMLRGKLARATEARPLILPALDEGRIEAGQRVFDLTVAQGQTEFFAEQPTDTIGINAPFLGPMLRMRAGDALRLNVTNALSGPTALHWHGLHLPAAADGGPHQPIAAGATWSPEFTLMQKAGSFWFHAHQHKQAGPQVWAGMAGMIRVEDDEEETLPLPRSYAEDDFALILQDRRFDAAFQMPYTLGQHERMAGMQGDRMLVNGQIGAVLHSPAPRLRLRILNASNGSFYRLHFADGRGFLQIASDGGLLEAAVPMAEALLSPGERAEYLVDLHDGAAALLRAEVFGAESPFSGPTGLQDVIELRPSRPQAPAPALPARLAAPQPVPAQTGETRGFTLAMTGADMMGSAMMGDPTINGIVFDHRRIDFSVPLGATETWIFENKTEMFHPMHIHDVQFRILSRNGQPPAPHEAGLKDVVLTRPGETVALRMAFTDYADPLIPYMLHCHVLEHEDAGMMAQFTVV